MNLLAVGGPPTASHAAVLYVRGAVQAARDETAAVLAKDSADARALFVRACLELETEGPGAAEPFVSTMEGLAPPPPQAVVLRRLLSRRTAAPSERVDDALAEAWKAVGRPDLSAVPLLPSRDSWAEDIIPPLPAKSVALPQALLVFSWHKPPERLKIALQASADAENNPLAVNLEILGVVTAETEARATEELTQIAARVGRAASATDASNGYLDLAAWLAHGPKTEPITGNDLSVLEGAIAKPRFEVPRRALFEELRRLAERIDPEFADLRARTAAVGTPVPVFRLWQRTEATKDEQARRRAARVMVKVAGRLACSGTVLERLLAAALSERSAEILKSPELAEARRAQEAFWAWSNAMRKAQTQLGTWPFAASLRDLDVTREVERYEVLAGPMPQPPFSGFSCQEHAK
jgi:hypothetical protein